MSEKYYLSSTLLSENNNKIVLQNKKKEKNKFVIDKNKFLNGGVCGYDTSTKYNQCRRLYSENGFINTLTASSIVDGSKIVVIDSSDNIRVRSLTAKEAFLLMGFSKEDYEKASNVNKETNLYYQSGNSIVVDVMYYILKKFLE